MDLIRFAFGQRTCYDVDMSNEVNQRLPLSMHPDSAPESRRDECRQWDDLPPDAKVVGIRKYPPPSVRPGYGLQQLGNDLRSDRIRRPKGVFRFKSHTEADAWWKTSIALTER